mmetsp:Transcript_37128/g.104802  ORF Transcript_37128/g.104802 Transcript_37128/m.104802 type:complete len:300 (+) Transcript_37128:253-1152(+)
MLVAPKAAADKIHDAPGPCGGRAGAHHGRQHDGRAPDFRQVPLVVDDGDERPDIDAGKPHIPSPGEDYEVNERSSGQGTHPCVDAVCSGAATGDKGADDAGPHQPGGVQRPGDVYQPVLHPGAGGSDAVGGEAPMDIEANVDGGQRCQHAPDDDALQDQLLVGKGKDPGDVPHAQAHVPEGNSAEHHALVDAGQELIHQEEGGLEEVDHAPDGEGIARRRDGRGVAVAHLALRPAPEDPGGGQAVDYRHGHEGHHVEDPQDGDNPRAHLRFGEERAGVVRAQQPPLPVRQHGLRQRRTT